MADRTGWKDDRGLESAMGGSTGGASAGHPAGSADGAREGRSPLPDDAAGDAAIERRMGHQPGFRGPERRISAK